MEERRAAARFEPLEEASLDDAVQQSGAGPSSTEAPAAVSDSRTIAPTVDDQDSYTARLMKAKKNALKNRNKPG